MAGYVVTATAVDHYQRRDPGDPGRGRQLALRLCTNTAGHRANVFLWPRSALRPGFAVGTTTAWRYVNETVALLAARAPKLRKAVRDAKKAGWAYVVLDGTLIPIDRVAADRPFYSGKHKKHGMNLQVIASPGGDILWVSGALPGSVHDKKAEWIWGVLAELEARAGHAGRQGLPGKRAREDPVPGKEQAAIPERGQPRPREAPLTWRARERPAQDLENPPQAPLLPLARRPARQGHPRIADPRRITRMEKVQYGRVLVARSRDDCRSAPLNWPIPD